MTLQNEQVFPIDSAMVAYTGTIKFEKSLLAGNPFLGALKRKATNKGKQIMHASGTGTVFFAQNADAIAILQLHGDRLTIESSRLLACDTTLNTSISFAGLRGAASGQGLFSTTVEGRANIAVISPCNLIMLKVTLPIRSMVKEGRT